MTDWTKPHPFFTHEYHSFRNEWLCNCGLPKDNPIHIPSAFEKLKEPPCDKTVTKKHLFKPKEYWRNPNLSDVRLTTPTDIKEAPTCVFCGLVDDRKI